MIKKWPIFQLLKTVDDRGSEPAPNCCRYFDPQVSEPACGELGVLRH